MRQGFEGLPFSWLCKNQQRRTTQLAIITPKCKNGCALELQDTMTEIQYLSAINSHFCYWTDADTGLFILRAVHGLDVLQGTPKTATTGTPVPATSQVVSPRVTGQYSRQPSFAMA